MPKATQLLSGEAGFEPRQPGCRDTLPNKCVLKAGQVGLWSSCLWQSEAHLNELECEDSVAGLTETLEPSAARAGEQSRV